MAFFTTATFSTQAAGRPAQWLLALLLLLAAPCARAQAPAWQTVASPNAATDRSSVFATAADASGNVYIAGGFYGSLTLGGFSVSSNGLRDLFVAKWSPAAGRFLWLQSAGSTGDEYVNGIAVNGSSVYLVGVFGSSQLQLGSTALTNANALATGINFDGYVAKLTDTGAGGTFAWAQSFGGTGTDYGNGIALNGSNVYVCGIFNSPALSIGAATLANAGATATPATTDAYFAKFVDAGSTGTFGWAERIGGAGSEFCSSLTFGNGSLYLGGSFNSSTLAIGTTTLTNASNGTATAGTEDVFVARVTDQGAAPAYNWGQQGGGPGSDQALRIAVVPGSVYIAGRITSPSGGNSTTFGSAVVPIAGLTDGYVAKLSDSGTAGAFAWVQGFGGPSGDYAYALAVRGSSVYAGGVFQGTASFGTASATSQGGTDAFVTRLVDAGSSAQVVWVQTAGGAGSEDVFALSLVGSRVFVAGDTTPVSAFGNIPVNSPTGIGFVACLASLTDAVGLATTPAAGPLAGTSLWPNPAHATATVQVPAVPGVSAAIITLRDALGRAVRTATVALPAAGQRHELGLAGLPAGLYVLQVQAGEARATHRLVVE